MSINKSDLGLYPLLFAVLIVANILIPKVDARDINNQNGIFADTRITSHVSKQYNPPFVYKNNNVISVVATTNEEVKLFKKAKIVVDGLEVQDNKPCCSLMMRILPHISFADFMLPCFQKYVSGIWDVPLAVYKKL